MEFNNILVICVGNICRSPIAATFLMDKYPDKHIESAGLSAVVGHGADAKTLDVMAPFNQSVNANMNRHVAKQISKDLTVKADLILTMSISQTKWIEDKWPHCRGKTFRIGHWIDQDIADPYGHNELAFETAKQDIINSLGSWFNKIS
jgi:protein-tyrosine phosphatase